MKKFLILLTFLIGFSSVRAQMTIGYDGWFISAGFNAVNSLGTQNPFKSADKWQFRTPFSASVEREFNMDWTGEIAINLNGLREGDVQDNGPAPEDYTYFSLDANAKWHFGRQIFRRGYDSIDFYVLAGLGIFTIDETDGSVNFGGGAMFWLNEDNTFGLRLQCVTKISFRNSKTSFTNNHYQWGIHAVWKLDN